MTGKSNTIPPLYSEIQKGLISCFVEAEQREDETGETRTEYSYHHVNINRRAGYGSIVSAIIHSKYTIDDEISLIKDKSHNLSKKTVKEHSDYLAFVDKAKIVAHAVLGNITQAVLAKRTVDDIDEIADALDVPLVYDNYSNALKAEKVKLILQRISMTEE